MKKIYKIIGLLAAFWLVSSFLGLVLTSGNHSISAGNVAVIPINGVIQIGDSSGLFSEASANPDWIIDQIDKAEGNSNVKAIVFEINSPGGSPVASDEIAQRIKKCEKPTVAWIREVGASGAYWIASSTDYVISNRMSLTGSIGVIGSYLDFSGLMADYNVSYERFVSGKYKDLGSPFRSLTEEEREKYQGLLDRMHEFFILEVAENRGLSEDDVRDLATGMVYLGIDAKELGLVDELGTKDTVKSYLENSLNVSVEMVDYKRPRSFFDSFGSKSLVNFINTGTPISIRT